jgi:lycopene beta-cyclase
MPGYDAVIAGGGLAGLSLAAQFAVRGWRDRCVLVVDDPRARTSAVRWGFWSATPGLLDAAVSRTYERARIHAGGTARILPLGRYRYHVVRRTDLAAVVRRILAGCPGFQVVDGTVEDVADDGTVTVDGRTVRGRWTFDSVTAPPAVTPVDAWLAFTGYEIRCAHRVFDPATPVLFDFRTPQDDGARFVYILPDSPDTALVELTAFVPRHGHVPAAADRRDALTGYLADVAHAGDYAVLRTESAVLPLRTKQVPRVHGRVVAIGARAGLVKASTGYAYQRIQRDSAALAGSLVRQGNPFGIKPSRRRYRRLDAVLLDVFDRDPPRLEQAFARLFARNPAERVLRFLDEDSRVPDVLRLTASLPPVPYLRALARVGGR